MTEDENVVPMYDEPTYKPLMWVRICQWYKDALRDRGYPTFPLLKEERLIYMGEIVNQRGHGIYMNAHGKMFVGYHLENFEEIPEDEV